MKIEDVYIERTRNSFSQFFTVLMLLVALFYRIKVDMPNMESVLLYFAVYMIFAPGGERFAPRLLHKEIVRDARRNKDDLTVLMDKTYRLYGYVYTVKERTPALREAYKDMSKTALPVIEVKKTK